MESKRKARALICLAMLTLISVALYFFKLHIPFCPPFFTIEFSLIPDTIASIAYGPIFGLIVCLIKIVIHIIAVPTLLITDITNLILNAIYVFVIGIFYMRIMYSENKEEKTRIKGVVILEGALISSFGLIIPQFLLTRFVSYPMLEKDLGLGTTKMALILEQYQISMAFIKTHVPQLISNILPDVSNISLGILVYNLPITFAKHMAVTLVVACIYGYLSPFLHNRR